MYLLDIPILAGRKTCDQEPIPVDQATCWYLALYMTNLAFCLVNYLRTNEIWASSLMFTYITTHIPT